MTGISWGRIGLVAAAAVALQGCDADGNFLLQPAETSEETATEPTTAAPVASIFGNATRREVVEAPEVFDVSDEALWDGRPSLGQVWVAYEDADPLSVVIRNEENGREVRGGLFRRERFFPGPPFQLSSDAAAELGILAGNPTRIRVIALTEVGGPEPEPKSTTETETAVTTEAEATPAPDVVEEAAIAIAVATGAPSAGPNAVLGETSALAAPQTSPQTIPAETPVIQEPPRPAPRRAVTTRPVREGPNAPEPVAVIATALPGAANTPTVTTTPEPAGPATETQPAVAPADTAPAPAEALERPFIQAGTFGDLVNAERAAERLRTAGIIPIIRNTPGSDLHRVLVGPARNADERAALLGTVRQAGFADAFLVTD